MAKTMDALASFTHLTDHLPQWLSHVQQLSIHATDKHAEFVAEYAKRLHEATTPTPKRKKSASIHSLRKDELQSEPLHGSTTHPDDTKAQLLTISPLEAGNQYLYAQLRRKRRPSPLSIRSRASGPQKYRSKQTVVVYYDAYIQEQLDMLVKQISSARNNLRKGKLARSLTRGLELPHIGLRFDTVYARSTEDVDRSVRSKACPPASMKFERPTPSSPTGDDKIFTEADRTLEAAQSLCETAAHQFLRDGDCEQELNGVQQKLTAALTLATEVVEKLKAEQRSTQTETDSDLTQSDSNPATLCEKPSSDPILGKLAPSLTLNNSLDALKHNLVAGTNGTDNPTPTAAIEVDDDSDASSIVVDMSKFRAARAAAATRMMARV